MFTKIDYVSGTFKFMIQANPECTFSWVIGKAMPEMDAENTLNILVVTGNSIYNMYRKVIGARVGVG